MSIKSTGEKILNFVLPNSCAICGRRISPFKMICKNCKDDIERSGPNLNMEKHRSFHLVYYGAYEGALRKLIVSYKSGRWRIGGILSNLCIETIEKLIKTPFCLTYIPPTLTSLEDRGFDHVKMIAKNVSQYFGMPLIKSIYPVIEDRQIGKSEQERKEIEGKYTFKDNVKGEKLVIIDDVYTTGATIKNAIEAIRSANDNLEIYACVIAKVRKLQG